MKTVLVCFLMMSGCTTAPSPANGDAATDVQQQAAKTNLSCLEILNCASKVCTDGGTACIDDCLSKGSMTGKQTVTDLATCYQNANCMDSTCLQANCKTQLDACIADSKPSTMGDPTDGGAPPGMIPADLVGTWIEVTVSDAEYEFVFNADGTARYDEDYNGTIGNCTSTQDFRFTGTAVFDTTALAFTLYGVNAQMTTVACGVTTTSPRPGETKSFTYEVKSPTEIWVTDQKCAMQYANDPNSANLYCRVTYHKQ